jgi:hypothetical protein
MTDKLKRYGVSVNLAAKAYIEFYARDAEEAESIAADNFSDNDIVSIRTVEVTEICELN